MGMMQKALQKILNGEALNRREAKEIMNQMMTGQASVAQTASLLTALRIRGETASELIGFAEGMREHATQVSHTKFAQAVDTCGTGGDGANTFNISTAAAFVTAAADVPVAKHGNRAASSQCGSADVLEALGIVIESDPESVKMLFSKTGICFLFAPMFHKAIKNVMPTRKELGFRTCFNLLGPLVNPANVQRQLVGVFDPQLTELVAEVLGALGMNKVLVVSSYDGLDEISITGRTRISELKEEKVITYDLEPHEVGLSLGNLEEIQGGNPKTNAEIIYRIFQGQKGAARDIVVLNAGAALYVADRVSTIESGVRLAEQLIDEGEAMKKLEETIEASKEVHHVS